MHPWENKVKIEKYIGRVYKLPPPPKKPQLNVRLKSNPRGSDTYIFYMSNTANNNYKESGNESITYIAEVAAEFIRRQIATHPNEQVVYHFVKCTPESVSSYYRDEALPITEEEWARFNSHMHHTLDRLLEKTGVNTHVRKSPPRRVNGHS